MVEINPEVVEKYVLLANSILQSLTPQEAKNLFGSHRRSLSHSEDPPSRIDPLTLIQDKKRAQLLIERIDILVGQLPRRTKQIFLDNYRLQNEQPDTNNTKGVSKSRVYRARQVAFNLLRNSQQTTYLRCFNLNRSTEEVQMCLHNLDREAAERINSVEPVVRGRIRLVNEMYGSHTVEDAKALFSQKWFPYVNSLLHPRGGSRSTRIILPEKMLHQPTLAQDLVELTDTLLQQALLKTVITNSHLAVLTLRYGLDGQTPKGYQKIGELLGFGIETAVRFDLQAIRRLTYPPDKWLKKSEAIKEEAKNLHDFFFKNAFYLKNPRRK